MKNKVNIWIISIITNIIAIALSYIVIFKAIIPIWSIENNEQDKSRVIGLKSNVASEFTADGKAFWWLESNTSILDFSNDSDEAIRGVISLYLSQNPCKDDILMNIEVNGEDRIDILIDRDNLRIELPIVNIGHYSNVQVKLQPKTDLICILKNGDSRKLSTKLEGWSFD
jgi:hypothetical protein